MITLEEQISLHDQTAAALRVATASDFEGQLQKSVDGVNWWDVSLISWDTTAHYRINPKKPTPWSIRDWWDVSSISWDTTAHYRINPKKLRPWSIREVPTDAWFRRLDTVQSSLESRVVGRSILSGTIFLGGRDFSMTTEYLAKCFLHSLDNGTTWLPCGIES